MGSTPASSFTQTGSREWDVFLSYAHQDADRVGVLLDALAAEGVRVWCDRTDIDEFAGITDAVAEGLARSRALVAYYSAAYPTRRACQWELTAAFLAAQRHGDPRARVLVVNPEPDATHIEPVELRDALASPVDAAASVARAAQALRGSLGAAVARGPEWHGRRPLGSARFVGRIPQLWAIHSALQARQSGLITGQHTLPMAQVRGLGGIGKSLLAEEYALRFGGAYPGGVFWLRADDSLADQLRAFARELGVAVATPEALVSALANRGEQYLWIVDDVPAGLEGEALERWLGPGAGACTLLTTRDRRHGALGTPIDLDTLDEEDAVRLLTAHRRLASAEDERAARDLARALAGHAQALDVAGAALRAEVGLRSFAQYREALDSLDEDELELAAGLAGALPNGHERSIAATLARSVQRLDPTGADFLRLAAQLAGTPIPALLVAGVFREADGLDADTARRRATVALDSVEALSLAELVDEEDGAREVHALVLRTVRFTDPGHHERGEALRAAAVRALTKELDVHAAPDGFFLRISHRSVEHARHLAAQPRGKEEASLLRIVAGLDDGAGDPAAAATRYRQLWEWSREALGESDSETLRALGALTAMLMQAGDLDAAEPLSERLIRTLRESRGEDHPETLAAMSNHAAALLGRDDGRAALAALRPVLDAHARVFGASDARTLGVRGNVAVALSQCGELEAAAAEHEAVLALRRRELEGHHPDVLESLHNLSAVRADLGALDVARRLAEEQLDGWCAIAGGQHPYARRARAQLIDVLFAVGDAAAARDQLEQQLELHRLRAGEDDPDALDTLFALAVACAGCDDVEQAAAYHREALERRRRVLGEADPATLESRAMVAHFLAVEGDPDTAIAELEDVLQITRRIHGDDALETFTALTNLGRVLGSVGATDRAQACLQEALEGCRRHVGDDHPATAEARELLALCGAPRRRRWWRR